MEWSVKGMHGLGDNLHQRAVIRQLMGMGKVTLETPWPCVYHDLVGRSLALVNRQSQLRTQRKNAEREASKFTATRMPVNGKPLQVSYNVAQVRSEGSVLAAMMKTCRTDIKHADFRLPIPLAWDAMLAPYLAQWKPSKPILIYRPLNNRKEWGGCESRNPDHRSYARLFRSIREHYFVVSVADFEPGKEWMVGEAVEADAAYHRGELSFEILAALTKRSSLVFTSPGFAVILAQAVGTASVVVFGGYEDSHSFSGGAHQAPYLGIDPIRPCQCFSHTHPCDKRINMGRAITALDTFAYANYPKEEHRAAD